jgi:hypothetical protein
VRLKSLSLKHIATGDLDDNGQADIVGDFPGLGLYVLMNNTKPFVRINNSVAKQRIAIGDLDGNGRDDVEVSFTSGTWVRYDNGTWRQIKTRQLLHAAIGDLDGNGTPDIVGDFAGLGVYAFMNNAPPFVQLHAGESQGLAVGDLNGNGKTEIVAIFASGTWERRDNGNWEKINTKPATRVIIGDLDSSGRSDVIGDFAGQGIYARYNNVGSWVRLRAQVSQGLAVGGFN